MRDDDPVLVEQGQSAGLLQHALDDEHHVWTSGVVFVEDDGDIVLHGPGQDAVPELGDLLAILEDDRILADEVDAADVAVEIDAHQRPVEPGGDLLNMGRLAGAVVALNHHPAVEAEAGEDRHGGVAVEQVVGVDRGRVGAGFRISLDHEIGVDPKQGAGGKFLVRQVAKFGHRLVLNTRSYRSKCLL